MTKKYLTSLICGGTVAAMCAIIPLFTLSNCSKSTKYWIKSSSINPTLMHKNRSNNFLFMSEKKIDSEVVWDTSSLAELMNPDNPYVSVQQNSPEYLFNEYIKIQLTQKYDKVDKEYTIKAKYKNKVVTTSIKFKNANTNDIDFTYSKEDILNPELDLMSDFAIPVIDNDFFDPNNSEKYIGDTYAKTKYGFLTYMYDTYDGDTLAAIVCQAEVANYVGVTRNFNNAGYELSDCGIDVNFWTTEATVNEGTDNERKIPLISYDISTKLIATIPGKGTINVNKNEHVYNMVLSSIGIIPNFEDAEPFGRTTLPNNVSTIEARLSPFYSNNDVSLRNNIEEISGVWGSKTNDKSPIGTVPVWDGSISASTYIRFTPSIYNSAPGMLKESADYVPSYFSLISENFPLNNNVSIKDNTFLSEDTTDVDDTFDYPDQATLEKYLLWPYYSAEDINSIGDKALFLNSSSRFSGKIANNLAMTEIIIYDFDKITPLESIFGNDRPWLFFTYINGRGTGWGYEITCATYTFINNYVIEVIGQYKNYWQHNFDFDE